VAGNHAPNVATFLAMLPFSPARWPLLQLIVSIVLVLSGLEQKYGNIAQPYYYPALTERSNLDQEANRVQYKCSSVLLCPYIYFKVS
jgi:hypothetical protein